MQRDEAGTRCLEGRMDGPVRLRAPELRADRHARGREQRRAELLVASESECRVAHDARLVARRVARVAQVEQLRRERVAPRAGEEAVDRRCAAGLRRRKPALGR